MRERKTLVLELIQNPKLASVLLLELAEHDVLCERHLAEVTKVDVLNVMKQFDHGSLSATEIETWASCLQGRMDVGFEFGDEGVVEEAVFWLANPSLHCPIDAEMHQRIAHLFERRGVRRN